MEIRLEMDFPPAPDGRDGVPLLAGFVLAEGLDWTGEAGSPRLAEARDALLAAVLARGEAFLPLERKAAVRNMLRFGAYKPAGRAKPSSEYLLQAALEGDFPSVNPFVDAVNLASLESGYPASVVDPGRMSDSLESDFGLRIRLRRGLEGESYVFNAGGQAIDLRDLLCLCRRAGESWEPCANPVRDSMATKLFPGARDALTVFYAPRDAEGAQLEAACERLRNLLEPLARRVAVLKVAVLKPPASPA